jgi:outer membrane protein assembly factor BamD
MNIKTHLVAAMLPMVLLFSGCSKNNVEEYNKPAAYWYSKIVENVSLGDLEMADNYYSSLQSEHIGSVLLPEATMILAMAHIRDDEHLLGEHFLDEYIKRYATENEKEEAEFLKVKSKYMALPNAGRDQAFIDEAIASAEQFKVSYANSMYVDVVDSMLTRMYLAQFVLNESIVDLYDRLDKPKSANYYRVTNPQPWIVSEDVNRASVPWYRSWFEGDGTSSWYDFMIPDTKSVVSRNSISEDENQSSTQKQPEEK